MDFDWTDKVAETLTIIFNDLISRLDHKDSLFFEDLSEIIFNGLMPRGCRSELTDV
jgi:hypothetical protein